MSDPLEILMQEHNEDLLLLKTIEKAAASIEGTGFSAAAFGEITVALDEIGSKFRKHMEKEERYLFPLVLRHRNGLFSSLRGDHSDLRLAFNELTMCVRDVQEGHVHGKSITELLRCIKLFIEQLRGHIDRETSILFPVVRQLLTPDEYEELRQGISSVGSSHAVS